MVSGVISNRTVGVNLDFHGILFRSSISTDAVPLELRSLVEAHFYTDAEKTPKQINPPGLKRIFGVYTVCVSDPVRLGNRTYRAWRTAKLTRMVRLETVLTESRCVILYRIEFRSVFIKQPISLYIRRIFNSP